MNFEPGDIVSFKKSSVKSPNYAFCPSEDMWYLFREETIGLFLDYYDFHERWMDVRDKNWAKVLIGSKLFETSPKVLRLVSRKET